MTRLAVVVAVSDMLSQLSQPRFLSLFVSHSRQSVARDENNRVRLDNECCPHFVLFAIAMKSFRQRSDGETSIYDSSLVLGGTRSIYSCVTMFRLETGYFHPSTDASLSGPAKTWRDILIHTTYRYDTTSFFLRRFTVVCNWNFQSSVDWNVLFNGPIRESDMTLSLNKSLPKYRSIDT
jgi:hypothetical protein